MPYKNRSSAWLVQKQYRDRKKLIGLCQICTKARINNTYCFDCNEKQRERARTYFRNQKLEVLNHYGAVCNCCGETEDAFLSIDHINGDGKKHRQQINGGKGRTAGSRFYSWIVKNNFPENLQVLCMNCNFGKYINKGVCPHRRQVELKVKNINQNAA